MPHIVHPVTGERVIVSRAPTPRTFWSYQAPDAPENPPENFKGTRDEWLQLSPGFRREIARNRARNKKG